MAERLAQLLARRDDISDDLLTVYTTLKDRIDATFYSDTIGSFRYGDNVVDRVLGGDYVPEVPVAFPQHILDCFRDINYDLPAELCSFDGVARQQLCRLLLGLKWHPKRLLIMINALNYQWQVWREDCVDLGMIHVCKDLFPAIWLFCSLTNAVLNRGKNCLSESAPAPPPSSCSKSVEFYRQKYHNYYFYNCYNFYNIIKGAENSYLNLNFIILIILIYTKFFFHFYIYKLADDIVMSETIKTKAQAEYNKGTKFRGKDIKQSGTENIIRDKANIIDYTKGRFFCKRCYDLDHIDPGNCIRRCRRCYGNHWSKECDVLLKCRWCGSLRGEHTCNSVDASSLYIKCPLCRFYGHSANKCDRQFVVLSQIFGPLKKSMARRSRFIKKARRITRRSRRIRGRRTRS